MMGGTIKENDIIMIMQGNILRNAYRMKSHFNFSYSDKLVEIFYFSGQKEDIHFMCSGDMIQNGVNLKLPACSELVCI